MNYEKKTGAELIAEERNEQIVKHGFQEQWDEDYTDEELLVAAQAAILGNPAAFPRSWYKSPFVNKICSKSKKDRLVIAGALIAAEIDRLNNIVNP